MEKEEEEGREKAREERLKVWDWEEKLNQIKMGRKVIRKGVRKTLLKYGVGGRVKRFCGWFRIV